MLSTGEVACLGDDFNEAFLKSVLSTGKKFAKKAALLSTGTPKNKTELLEEIISLKKMGLKFYGQKARVLQVKRN